MLTLTEIQQRITVTRSHTCLIHKAANPAKFSSVQNMSSCIQTLSKENWSSHRKSRWQTKTFLKLTQIKEANPNYPIQVHTLEIRLNRAQCLHFIHKHSGLLFCSLCTQRTHGFHTKSNIRIKCNPSVFAEPSSTEASNTTPQWVWILFDQLQVQTKRKRGNKRGISIFT